MESPCFSDSGVKLPIHPQAIAFDLDGTLLDYDGYLSEPVSRAVRLIHQSGIKVFLITGRMQSGCERHWQALGLDTPVATCNGAHVGFFDEEPIVHTRLSEKARDIIMEVSEKHGIYVNYYVDGLIYALHDGPYREHYSGKYSPVLLAPDRDDILSRRAPTKCLAITAESEQAEAMRIFAEALGDEVNITKSNDSFIELLPPGADKGTGLRALAEWAGIPVDSFIAVGDALNDLPMLQTAGFAIGFKSGDPKLTEHVDMLLPPLWEDGMEVLAKCVLGLTNTDRFLTARSSRFFKK